MISHPTKVKKVTNWVSFELIMKVWIFKTKMQEEEKEEQKKKKKKNMMIEKITLLDNTSIGITQAKGVLRRTV